MLEILKWLILGIIIQKAIDIFKMLIGINPTFGNLLLVEGYWLVLFGIVSVALLRRNK